MNTLIPLLAASTLGLATAAHAGDQVLPPMGGSGGGQFFARCQGGDILNGFELRTGNDVDAIRPICTHPLSPGAIGPRNVYSQKFGGDGGGNTIRVVCPDNEPLITALEITYEGEDTRVVNGVHLFCTITAINQSPNAYPTVVFDGPPISVDSGGLLTGGDPVRMFYEKATCPRDRIAVGINGRSGIWLDAVSFICGDLPAIPMSVPVKSLGRVKPTGPPAPPRPICDSARDARARNSPAAPNLEAQCAAYLAAHKPVVNSIARTNTTVAATARVLPAGAAATPASPAPPPDRPTPPAQDLDALAARGAAIAQANVLANELREQIPDGPARRGFDIGMASYENQTVPDRINGAAGQQLDPATYEGFRLAQAFSLNWNRSVDLAVIGAMIARDDPVIARARDAEADAFYHLGFDIATGLYGDRKRGARGNTATGPGAFAIGDQLPEAGQRGFNASTALNISRHY